MAEPSSVTFSWHCSYCDANVASGVTHACLAADVVITMTASAEAQRRLRVVPDENDAYAEIMDDLMEGNEP